MGFQTSRKKYGVTNEVRLATLFQFLMKLSVRNTYE